MAPRLPDFVVIGTMKSGSTTLFNWLSSHPGVQMPSVKEPNFFCDGQKYAGRKDWYTDLFRQIPSDKLTGEASVRYTDPEFSAAAARRVREMIPSARLICVLRHPVDRLRSHYRHEVQRGREVHEFALATGDVSSAYVRRSCYALALQPWLETFPGNQIHLATYEGMFREVSEWERLLSFLGLEAAPYPDSRFNVTADKASFSPAMRLLWDAGIIQRVPTLPKSLRRIARQLLLRPPEARADLIASAEAPVAAAVMEILSAQVNQLALLVPDLSSGWDLSA